jgi:acetyl esterase/lipase
MASSTNQNTQLFVSIQPQTPWHKRITLNLKILLTRTLTNIMLSYHQIMNPFPQPSNIKSFPTHPNLKTRIFYPSTHETSPKISLPLFLDIHGGGFILFDPSINDTVNTHLATQLNCLVISLDYSKAPSVKFPIPTNEIVDTIMDILHDRNLSFDRSRVVLGGYSAGGNLAFSAAQSPQLHDRLAGIVSWYPATDFSDDPKSKALLRPYDTAGEVDPLVSQIPGVLYAYVNPGQDRTDSRLSPVFTQRSKLPKHIMIIGAENDILAHEAWRAARNLAGLDSTSDWEEDQTAKYGFDIENVKWLLIKGARHGFTHFQGGNAEVEVKRKMQEQDCFAEFRAWMEKGPFAVSQ